MTCKLSFFPAPLRHPRPTIYHPRKHIRWRHDCSIKKVGRSAAMLMRMFARPKVLVERRARLERTVLGTRDHISVVDCGRSAYEARRRRLGRAAGGGGCRRRRVTGGRVVRRSGCRRRRRRRCAGIVRQSPLVFAEQFCNGPVALLCRDISRCRPVLRAHARHRGHSVITSRSRGGGYARRDTL